MDWIKNNTFYIQPMLIALGISFINDNTTKQSSNNLKDTIVENKILEKNTQQLTEIEGPVGKISVVQHGEGGTSILFIHSFGGSTAHWKNQMQHLQTKTVTMDLRGHGNSDTPANNDFAIESHVKDVEAVVNGLGLDKFILVGHSMGGSVAIAYAGKHPDKIVGLLLTGTPGKMPPEQATQIITSLESDKYKMVMDDYMKKLLINATPETVKMETEGMNKLDKEKSVSIIKESFAYDPLPAFKKYTGPKLIVDIADMEAQPSSLHTAFPNVPYKTISGTSHWMQLDKPDDFNKILDEFLKEVEKK
jgi:pimeloyl-ACP methyl ester carboxylesterase